MYEKSLENSLIVLETLDTPVPEKGGIAGAGIRYRDWQISEAMANLDNLHYPMGTSFLRLGISGIIEKARLGAEKASSAASKDMFSGIVTVYEAVKSYFRRYSDKIRLEANGDERLLKIADTIDVLTERAPIHFDEALQLYALMWTIRSAPSAGSTIGRLDMHLFPFYEKDIKDGYTTDEKVFGLLCDFWDFLNTRRSGDTLNNLMVGGRNADGTDASNRLSVLMLEATKICGKSEPHINVRVHKNMNPEIRRAMLEVQAMGQGQATVYNDDIIIPGLVKFGIPEKMACTYINDGCYEVMLDGYSDITFTHLDAVAIFELAFNNGEFTEIEKKPIKYRFVKDPERIYVPDAKPGFSSGRVEDAKTFDEFYNMFLSQYEYQTREKAEFLKKKSEKRFESAETSLFLNGTYDIPLDTGTDLLRGGFPVYVNMLFSGSLTTVADCMAAIKKLVYDEKKYTIEEIKKAISVDFEGFEAMRLDMCSAPKFGNDIDEVDLIAADLSNHFCKWLEDFREETDFAVMPALLGWKFLQEAYGIAATPDGRHYTDPIAEHYCATPGKGTKGPTAIINSIAKSKDAIAKAIGVCGVHISLPRNIGDKEKTIAVIDSLIQTACDKGLNQINIAMYDADLLREAQRDPENHRDLVVRVWGYCARFIDLCVEMQEHVISRILK